MTLGPEDKLRARPGEPKFTLVELPDEERDDYESKPNFTPEPPSGGLSAPRQSSGGLSALQRSSFAFLPAAIATLVRALIGTRLLLSHAWTCGVFALSVANHSRDYRNGPEMDALDATDKIFAWALGASCAVDGFLHLSRWRFWTAFSLGWATLALYCATRFFKYARAENTSPGAPLRAQSTFLSAELAHVCMHFVAGLGTLLVVV